RFSSRPCCRQRPGRCRPLLGQADQIRPPRRAALPGEGPLLLQRPPPSPPPAVVRPRRHRAHRGQAACRGLLPLAVHHRPALHPRPPPPPPPPARRPPCPPPLVGRGDGRRLRRAVRLPRGGRAARPARPHLSVRQEIFVRPAASGRPIPPPRPPEGGGCGAGV